MIASESFLETVVERARAYVNDPDTEAKYTDDWVIRHCVMPAMTDVLARLNLSQDNPIINRITLTLSTEDRYYQLPPCVGEVLEIGVYDSNWTLLQEAKPRDFLNPFQSGWRLEGNQLVIEPLPSSTDTARVTNFQVSFISNGQVYPHLSEDGGTLEEDADGVHTVWLDPSPDKGALDRRPNAYVGQMIRLIPANGAVEERVIGSSGYTGGRFWVTTRSPFTEISAPQDTIKYEIAPQGHEALYDAIALLVGYKLGVMCRRNESHLQGLQILFRNSMKTIKDNLHTMQQRRPKRYAADTRDNDSYQYLF